MCFQLLQSMSFATCQPLSETSSVLAALEREQMVEWMGIEPNFPCVSHGGAGTFYFSRGGKVPVTRSGAEIPPRKLPRIPVSP